MLRSLVVAAALAATVPSATAIVIAGSVSEDPQGLAVRASFTPLAQVSVKLYRDGGSASVATSRTNASGFFLFNVDQAGTYWIAVDSKTIRPAGGAAAGVLAEQTFGPAGALCAQPMGEPRTNFVPDVCIGGRTIDGADDTSSLATSEHVARVAVADQVTNLDFAFSFNVVSRTDDPDGAPRQGTLRQFVVNANAIEGPNWMRFLPLAKAPVQEDPVIGVQPRWWVIRLATPLPVIRDAATTIDGTAYSHLSPASRVDVNPGHLNDPAWNVGALHPERPRQEKPELELVTTGDDGVICEARCGVRALAIHGSPTTIIARADATLEQLMVGARPSGTVVSGGTVGVLIERGTTTARMTHVTSQSTAGLSTLAGSKLDAHGLDVQRCGSGAAGAGVVLQSDGSSIIASSIEGNLGAGIVVGSPTEVRPASGNTIADSVIASSLAGIVLSAGANNNVIARNEIIWNRLGGVVVAPFESNAPLGNRITMNRYDENGGRPIVLDLAAPMNSLWRGVSACEPVATKANAGIVPPVITSARVSGEEGSESIAVAGKACPGQTVELYQSYVTSGVREKTVDLSLIRPEAQPKRETLVIEQDGLRAMPSIGEFNHIGTTVANADGTFNASFPFTRPQEVEDRTLTQSRVLSETDLKARAVSGVAIDAQGNTSELSSRRTLEGLITEKR